MMKMLALYPLLLVPDVEATAQFYEQNLGFTRVFSSDWYVHLRSPADQVYELAVIHYQHDTIPEVSRKPTSGLLLSFEVADSAAEHARMLAAGVEIVQPLRDEVFGQRHFIASDPNGILLDIITQIEPDPEWLKAQGQ
ncbi:VOC family protein [Devosia lacusdianchii]|uniref:VOC family protein n=1 Tax=Devosia lacusdianchii TaxID=2917991 RepID=UPI001F06E451|nr:VOC family protein [Devosia sp. JXJ CY 41]